MILEKQVIDVFLDEITYIIENIYNSKDSNFFTLIYNGNTFIKIGLSDEERLNFIYKNPIKNKKL